ncbi:hypothetical protein [Phenylobacterium sp.]|uniref:hypothetical protein n=1 Tax=Phenylobacterium sp. TaxID=1871053 RepID=UPI002737D3D0|nr:hypothetical protein [Phenylobacterium sp.]MDP3869926.1 hypothetical protein [Phenylobacterium sp.]
MNPITPTTELEAVNGIISVIGELPIDDLRIADTNADVKLALQLLRGGTRSLQIRGWKFNTDEGVTLYRDPDGTIPLPTNCVRCVISEPGIDMTVRGQRIYNRTTHGYVWTQDLVCDLTSLLAFDELPEAVRSFLTEKIGQKFQARAIGSPVLDSFTREDIEEAAVTLSEFELDDGQYNFLTGSSSVTSAWTR